MLPVGVFWSRCLGRAHLLLLWAVQGSSRVEHGLLGVIEELRNVLQVFSRTLRSEKMIVSLKHGHLTANNNRKGTIP